ncbi:M57 family metalloprotease [Marinigracilibium pacificum]|uniref:Peptidase n=1 Tax=Marinigracilibium pacificum TaxID=2729599 RepID=A0A848J1U7_9BACT|nr:M57 family metalloprotease [Marinigracilibium pacificum]NMM48444.1 peptidase [Marinigracilibium pacificum]
MKQLRISFLCVAVIAFTQMIFVSCTNEESLQPKQSEISEEVIAQFYDLGFDVSDIRMTDDVDLLDPASESGNYLLEGDIIITPENLQEMLKSEIHSQGPNFEQYRTNNLVSAPRTIRVIGYTANNSNGLDNTMRTALQWAVDNYNRLNTGLNFTLTFGTNYNSYDMVVYRTSGGGGGSAGFPSGGKPYKWIQIQSGTSSYGTNVVEHVMTHEIGHAVGLRHTDYFNRSYSCGSGGNEGDGGVGAVHVPGTPTGVDPNSIMLACFSANEDGEFGQYDIVALERLY